MKGLRTIGITLLTSALFTTGCWDRTELNDLALLLGWGMDIAQDGTYISSAQIVIPGKATGSGQTGAASAENAYFEETGVGTSVSSASQNMQTKVSRRIFAGHRKDIFIGEELAKHGVQDVVDEYSRNPDVRLRTDAFVVKGGTAEDLLKVPQHLEKIPALGALKIHKTNGGVGDVVFANFLIDAVTEGNSPTLPALAMTSNSQGQGQEQGQSMDSRGFAYAGRAVFDKDLKLIGYLNTHEAAQAFWVKGRLKFYTVTGVIPEGHGNVSMDLRKLGSKIRPIFRGKRLLIDVTLSGQGIIRENNTNLNLAEPANVSLVESALDKEYENQIQQLVTKMQKEYKADVFGFGAAVHRKYPSRWKTLKKNWDQEFADADVVVRVNLKVKQVGLTGAPLQLREPEVKK